MTKNHVFSEKSADLNPFIQFDIWYKERLSSGIEIPNTLFLSTVSGNGNVSSRTLLLKDYNESGFYFFTNYNSKKGSHLRSNNRVALLFYWPEYGRQVRIEGFAEKVTEKESESYFETRPRENQLSAWASEQSTVIPDRQYLESRFEYFLNKYKNMPVEKPKYWGGYRVVPDWFEFWQEGASRLHDRISYSRKNNSWILKRLAP
jgi:pyridoxamine 5'-phosphate oxidase